MPEDGWRPMETPGHYISRIARGLARIGDARLRPLGFATAQLPVLSALRNGARKSQTELARWAKVEQPTMAQLLARMERDGLVRREPDPADRRSSLVSLTADAQSKLAAGRDILLQGNKDATRGLSDEEVDTLLSLLQRVLANVEAMDR
ncbi:MarR family winged helix-turn-helix transcriptional regulator [Xanthobacter sediminis]